MIWLLILAAVLLPYFGLGGRANLIIAVIILIIGVILTFTGFDLRLDVN